ncbi:MAG: UDP-N-acetylmuramate--L-alanine ligase, partial [Lachnospiraceae bacterium]|nr:UDP-N-acetylmuramate--L-alanine ligase [Lachnospiraceae bacterium]
TSAIHPDNPEYMAMQEKQIPSLSRAQLLGQMMKNYENSIAISGTHGKTTTTSMISEILLQSETNPTLSIGGILKTINSNYLVGDTKYFVTEACDYTNSFLSFYPTVGIILNIEEDHLDFFKDLNDIRQSFRRFAELLPEDGALIIHGDIENIDEITNGLSCKVITFGSKDSCCYYPSDITYNAFGCAEFICCYPEGHSLKVTLGVPGEHNIYNALSAIALAKLLGIKDTDIQTALSGFKGPGRRFEHKGEIGGVTVIDDYAHHPTEIAATLSAAQKYPHKTTWCVFQPHTYTRTKSFLKEFAEALTLADKVVLADIYAARETDTLGISSETLQKEIISLGKECFYFPSFDEIENFLLENCTCGDLLITMGAGDVHKIGENLLGV